MRVKAPVTFLRTACLGKVIRGLDMYTNLGSNPVAFLRTACLGKIIGNQWLSCDLGWVRLS